MCGIFGFYLNRRLKDDEIENGKKLLQSIKYRGPDYTGYWYDKDKGIFIGHNRLSILDLTSNSHQPFKNKDSVLVFNGEIYNYKSIRDSSLKDERFNTTSDTEVLSKYLYEYNCKFLDKIDGMFSFCFFKDDILTISNDIFSEKTIYYAKNKEGIYFCSEAGPLIKLLDLKISKDESIKSQFMSLGYIIPPMTGFNNLFITSQANVITIKKGLIVSNIKYYDFPKLNSYKGKIRQLEKSDIKNIKNSIIESVESRMQTDVDMGIFLSSGNDSSLIASIMKKELNINPLALTINYEKYISEDETSLSKKISKYLGIDHVIEKDDSFVSSTNNLDEIINLYNDLNDNTTILLLKRISKVARKYFKVAISGNGGDEMFYGYGKHEFFYKFNAILNSKYLNNILKNIDDIKIFPNKIRLATSLSKFKNYNKILALNNFPFFSNHESKEGYYYFNDIINKNQNMFENFRDFNLIYNLPNGIIQSAEKGSMRSSIELRSPFLTKNILEIVSNLDFRSLMLLGRKGILRVLLKDYLPKELILERKKGFIYPLDYTINDENLKKYSLNDYKKKINSNYNWKKLVVRKMIYNEMNNLY